MTPDRRDEARRKVEHAAARDRREEHERAAGSATDAAVARTLALQKRSALGRFAYENGLAIAALALFLLSFVGQVWAGLANYNSEQRDHGAAAVTLGRYLHSGAFLEATAENWESEFLQMAVFVVLTAFLYQRGSSESKEIETPDPVDERPEEARDARGAPWPVRRGGIALTLYRHSLSLALLLLFLASFALHVAGGAAEYSEEQRQHGGAPVSVLGYLATSRLWFESFQNWQSEFLSVGVLVLLTVGLREQGSPQSKPVAASSEDTGE